VALSILLAVIMGVQPVAATTSEILAVDLPDEFQVGHHQRNEKAEIIELMVPPETVENWSTLVTSLMFFGAAKTGLDAFYVGWRNGLRDKCPGLTDETVRGNVDGHTALRATLSCPNNPQTGKPENLTAFLVQGEANLMLAQVAFRHTPSETDVALIGHVAGSLKVCDQATLALCSARKATGFLVDQPPSGR
jgi:hypothetical protein